MLRVPTRLAALSVLTVSPTHKHVHDASHTSATPDTHAQRNVDNDHDTH